MANNLAPYLLRPLEEISGQATPSLKIQMPGFLNFLKSQDPFNISVGAYDGTKREVRIGYRPRVGVAEVRTSKSCDYTAQPTELETTVSVGSTRQYAFHISDELVAQYMSDASDESNVGKPPTPIMRKFLQNIYAAANALLMAVDQDVLTLAAAAVGRNRVTGANTSKTINISKDGTVTPLTDGLTEILKDYQVNEFYGRPAMIGSGLMHSFMVQRFAQGTNQSGLDKGALSDLIDFYYDQNAASIVGSNQVLVYEPGAVQLIEYLEYTGFKAGPKPGGSTFGVIPIPVQTANGIIPVEFDFQLRYNDCAVTATEGYAGGSITLQKGYNMILSKQFGLFTIPTDAYKFHDELWQNRGSLRYTITNDCDECEA